jgi:hypothetical protein
MSRFHRKTAPGVRDGRVRKKNNWTQSPSLYIDPQPRLVIDRRPPGAGCRHLLFQRDIERFVNLIPNWNELAVGLDVIALDSGRRGCDGWYDRGAIGICAWRTDMCYEVDPDWFREHRDFLKRIGVRVYGDDPETVEVHWTADTARAYQLCHVFLHELGHHADRMHTRTKTDNSPRGEGFAEDYAFTLEVIVLERYFEEFGLPD